MIDDEIVATLRASGGQTSAVELAELLDRLTSGRLSQGSVVTYFKRAFPCIPLRILLEAGAWTRVSGGAMTDDQFNELLRPWIGQKVEHE